MIGSSRQLRALADLAHRLEAVHLRHHDVHQDHVDAAGRAPRTLERLAAVAGDGSASRRAARARSTARRCCGRRPRRSGRCGPRRRPRGCAPPAASCWRSAGRSASTWWRNSVTSSSSRSGERAPLMMIDFEYLRSRCSSSRRQRPPGVDDDRRERGRSSSAIFSSSSKPDASGSERSSTMQSKVEARSCSSAAAAVATGTVSDLVGAEQVADALALHRVVLDDQHRAQALGEPGLEPRTAPRPAARASPA